MHNGVLDHRVIQIQKEAPEFLILIRTLAKEIENGNNNEIYEE